MRTAGRAYRTGQGIHVALALAGLAWLGPACAQSDTPRQASEGVTVLQGKAELEAAVREGGSRLMLLDLYADWCGPCRMVAPILEEIAREKRETVAIHKIDIDRNRDLAAEFGVTGIPLVLFLREGRVVHRLMGAQPKMAYLRAIEQFAPAAQQAAAEMPDGELVHGVRVIRLAGTTSPEKLYVYRGETVRLVLAPTGAAYSIHLPEFAISAEGAGDRDLEVEFKAETVGVYPIYCNGRCPLGDGAQQGALVVMPFAPGEGTRFTEVTTAQAVELIARADPLILDVRTPAEHRDGHLSDARLIPLDQLAGRMSEIEAYRARPVLIYCRSGNRSTVAAEILVEAGFSDLYHLRHGMRDWVTQGQPVAH